MEITTPTPEEIQEFHDALVWETNFLSTYILLIVAFVAIGLISGVLTIYDWRRHRRKYVFPVFMFISAIALVIVGLLDTIPVNNLPLYFNMYLADPEFEQAWLRALNASDVAGKTSVIGAVFSFFFFILGLAGIFKNWFIKKPNQREVEV
jgi:hypothetical protein